VIAERTKRAEDARNTRDKWSLPKHASPSREYSWHGREIAYKEAIELLLDAVREASGVWPRQNSGCYPCGRLLVLTQPLDVVRMVRAALREEPTRSTGLNRCRGAWATRPGSAIFAGSYAWRSGWPPSRPHRALREQGSLGGSHCPRHPPRWRNRQSAGCLRSQGCQAHRRGCQG
jgi:hypothetical protein